MGEDMTAEMLAFAARQLDREEAAAVEAERLIDRDAWLYIIGQALGDDTRRAATSFLLAHRPSRALARMEADREVLAFAGTAFTMAAKDPDSRVMQGSAAAYQVWLRRLLKQWSDEPGYREEWAPDE